MACRFSALPPLQKNLLRDAKYLQLAWRISADLTMNHRPDSEGTAGVGMGCNLFQSGDSIAMVQAVGKVVHERLQPKPAYEFYEDAKSAQGAHSWLHVELPVNNEISQTRLRPAGLRSSVIPLRSRDLILVQQL